MQFAWAFCLNLIQKAIFKCCHMVVENHKLKFNLLKYAIIIDHYSKFKFENGMCMFSFGAKIYSTRTHTLTHVYIQANTHNAQFELCI